MNMEFSDASEMEALDRAIGAFIAKAWENAAGYAANASNQFKEFLERPTEKQIYRGTFSDASDLLKKISGGEKTAETLPTGERKNIPGLPVAGYYRTNEFSTEDRLSDFSSPQYVSSAIDAEALSGDGIQMAMIVPMDVTYHMTFAAHKRPALDQMVTAWIIYQARNDRFEVPYIIAGGNEGAIRQSLHHHRAMNFADESVEGPPYGKIWAAGIDIKVNATMIAGLPVTLPSATTVKWEFTGYCGRDVTGAI